MNSNIMPTQMAARRRTCGVKNIGRWALRDSSTGASTPRRFRTARSPAGDRTSIHLGLRTKLLGGRPACVKMDRMACGNAIQDEYASIAAQKFPAKLADCNRCY